MNCTFPIYIQIQGSFTQLCFENNDNRMRDGGWGVGKQKITPPRKGEKEMINK